MIRARSGLLVFSIALLSTLIACGPRAGSRRDAGTSARPSAGRLIVLGFDGVDPRWLDRFIADGKLPTMKRLVEANGGASYRRLASTIPPQSPVAWATFATGTQPGQHGIFDFIRPSRNPAPAQPVLPMQGTTTFERPDDGPPATTTFRRGIPFWKTIGDEGIPVVSLNVPYSFPPDPMRHGRIVSGLGVPDLLGINSCFTYATSAPPPEAERTPGGGRIIPISLDGDAGSFVLEGPSPARGGSPTSVSVSLRRVDGGKVEATIAGRALVLEHRRFSEFVEVDFAEGSFRARGIVRLLLLESSPTMRVFITPISPNPREPWFPISHPDEFAGDVADDLGRLYKTVGWDHDTSSLNTEVLDDELFLADMDAIETDRREMLLDALARDDFRMLLWVSTSTDRVAHMFYRLIDPQHPRYDAALAAEHGDAIENEYRRMDETVRLALASLRPNDTLLILSDHGFHDYRRGLHVNRWLAENGFLTFNEGRTVGRDMLVDVDWTQTQAYALGTGQIYLNLRGREREGIVSPSEARAIAERIGNGLRALRDSERENAVVVSHVYYGDDVYRGRARSEAPDVQLGFAENYRTSWESILGGAPLGLFADNPRKWSGDHSASAAEDTPGILISNRPLVEHPGIVDLAPSALGYFDVTVPGHYEGRTVFAQPR